MSGAPKRLGNRDRQLNYYPKRPWPECVPEKSEALKVIRFGIPTPHVFKLASSLANDWTAQERANIEVVAEYLALTWQVAAAAALKPTEASGTGVDALRGQLGQAKTILLGVQKNRPELSPLITKALNRADEVLRVVGPKLGWGSTGGPSPMDRTSPDSSGKTGGSRKSTADKGEDEKGPWWKKVFK